MPHRKTIPVLVFMQMSEYEYYQVADLARRQNKGICTMFQDLAELGLLTLAEYDKRIVQLSSQHLSGNQGCNSSCTSYTDNDNEIDID